MAISFKDLEKNNKIVVMEEIVSDTEWLEALSDLEESDFEKINTLKDSEVVDYILEQSDVRRYAKAGAKIHTITGAIGGGYGGAVYGALATGGLTGATIGVVAGTAAGAAIGAASGAALGALAGSVRKGSRRFGKEIEYIGRKIKDIGANIEQHNKDANDEDKKKKTVKESVVINENVNSPDLYRYNDGRNGNSYYFYGTFDFNKLKKIFKRYHGDLAHKVENKEEVISKHSELKNISRYTLSLSDFTKEIPALDRAKNNEDYDYQQDIMNDIQSGYNTFKVSFRSRLRESVADVNLIHKEEVYDLYDEVADLIENLDFLSPSHYNWRNISTQLRALRDTILETTDNDQELAVATTNEVPVSESEEVIDESYKAGSLKLKDGTKVKLSKDDASALNKMMNSTKEKDSMNDDVTRDKKSFDEIIAFARSLNEQIELDEVSYEYLNKYLHNAIDGKDEAIVQGAKARVDMTNNPSPTNLAVKTYWDRQLQKRKDGLSLANKRLRTGYNNVKEGLALGAPALETDVNLEKKKNKEEKDTSNE